MPKIITSARSQTSFSSFFLNYSNNKCGLCGEVKPSWLAAFLLCTREVRGSDVLTEVSRGFAQFLQTCQGAIHQIIPRLRPYYFFPAHYSLTVLSSNVIQFKPMTASLSELFS